MTNETSGPTEVGGTVMWLTGLFGLGNTTIARGVAESLRARGLAVVVLDGDDLRAGLSPNLGFSRNDRDEHVRRVGFIADLIGRSAVVAIVAAISPYRETRDAVRAHIQDFIEVFVDCPLEVLERRDTKGLYARAGRREVRNLTGVDDPYEEPLAAELRLDTASSGVTDCVEALIQKLEDLCYVRAIASSLSGREGIYPSPYFLLSSGPSVFDGRGECNRSGNVSLPAGVRMATGASFDVPDGPA